MVALLFSMVAVVTYLAFPGSPGPSRTLSFDGYLPLPATGALSALDYLAIGDRRLFVSSLTSGKVAETGLEPSASEDHLTVRSTLGGGSAHGVALDEDLRLGLVTRSGLDAVDIFDLGSLGLLQRLSVPAGPDAILRDPQTGLIYVANAGANEATLIDPVARKVVATIALPGQPEYAVLDPHSDLLFQNIEDKNSVAVLSLAKRTVVGHWLLSSCDGPSGIALDDRRRRLFVVCSGNARLGIYDLASHQVIASLPIGRLSDSVAYDPVLDRIYVAGGAGQLTVIDLSDQDRYRIVDRVRTHLGAHTLAVDPSTHRLYVAYAGFITAPRVAVFSPRHALPRPRSTEEK